MRLSRSRRRMLGRSLMTSKQNRLHPKWWLEPTTSLRST
uniref:Uncharacterized protein n=1 Tax=Anguilla anguilla TaxID=7936 RepID=A0A0E9XDJ1_ANGAN